MNEMREIDQENPRSPTGLHGILFLGHLEVRDMMETNPLRDPVRLHHNPRASLRRLCFCRVKLSCI